MSRKIVLTLTLGIGLCGCSALTPPASPQEFRRAAGSSSMAVVRTLEVPKPYPQVAALLRKKAGECLAVTSHSSGPVFQGNMTMIEHSRTVYKAAVTEAHEKSELAVQADFGKKTPMQTPPAGGFYILVADAAPAGTNATRVTIYRGSLGKAKEIHSAIEAWVKGESASCPDLDG